jgi:3-methylfumaryl-CoA hydratase
VAGERVRQELLRTEPAAAYRSTFAPSAQAPVVGEPLPPGWEGIYFPFDTSYAGLRPDGSPGADDVVAEVGLPRRMYAGEDTRFTRPLRYGDTVEQRTRTGSVTRKQGRAGELVFVDIERTYAVAGEVAVTSTWHDVFLPATDPGEPPRATPAGEPGEWDWTEEVTLDSRQLFRYSALTFNTHRVHYDRSWAQGVEGLPDLLVHGPLMRMLLLDFASRSLPGIAIGAFSMRSMAPVYVDQTVVLAGRVTPDGVLVCALDAANRTLARGRVS